MKLKCFLDLNSNYKWAILKSETFECNFLQNIVEILQRVFKSNYCLLRPTVSLLRIYSDFKLSFIE